MKDMYELLAMNKEVDTEGEGTLTKGQLGYEPRYYMFNNTRMQFPAVKFSQQDPILRDGDEMFCIHYYWEM